MAKLMTVIKQFAAKPNNALFAAAARPHDPADYARPALDGSGPAAETFHSPARSQAPRSTSGPREHSTVVESRWPMAPPTCEACGKWSTVA